MVRANSDANPKCSIVAPWTPRPPSATPNRHMVPAECEPGTERAFKRAEEHVETMMLVVRVPGRGDVDSCSDRDENKYEQVDRWSCRLATWACSRRLMRLRNRISQAPYYRLRYVLLEWSRSEEWDRNRELGS